MLLMSGYTMQTHVGGASTREGSVSAFVCKPHSPQITHVGKARMLQNMSPVTKGRHQSSNGLWTLSSCSECFQPCPLFPACLDATGISLCFIIKFKYITVGYKPPTMLV